MKQVKKVILTTIALIFLLSTTAFASSPKAPFLNYMNSTTYAVSKSAKKSDTTKYADVYFQHGAGYAKYGVKFRIVKQSKKEYVAISDTKNRKELGHFRLNYKSGYNVKTDGYHLYTTWGSAESGYLDNCYVEGVWYP